MIPSREELKRKRYCKWHHSRSHRTNDCTMATTSRGKIQKEISEGRFIFADQENKNMEVDQNPFPSQVNMVDVQEKALVQEKMDQDIANTEEHFGYAYGGGPK